MTGANAIQPLKARGDVVGSYEILRLLGQGGMGQVFLAQHERLKRKVALKVLLPSFSQDEETVGRFFAEARAVNEIGDEHVVDVTDFVDKGPDKYIVMEFLDGRTLHEVLQAEGRVAPRRALRIGKQIASALHRAHEVGVMHRDLKPGNVFLIERGGDPDFVKLIDFGVARVSEDARGSVDGFGEKTAAGKLLGTPAYMAPEQLLCEEYDFRAEVYTFGILLFQLTTGRRPFVADTVAEVVAKQLQALPPRLDDPAFGLDVPERLADLVAACLEKSVADRPSSLAQVAATLEDIERELEAPPATFDELSSSPTGELSAEEVASGDEIAGPGARPGGRAMWVGIASALLLAALIGASFLFDEGDDSGTAVADLPPPVVLHGRASGEQAAPALVRIDSSPSGAEVTRAADAVVLGATPLEVKVEQGSPLVVSLALSGYQTATQEVSGSESDITVALEPDAPSTPSSAAASPVAARPSPKQERREPRAARRERARDEAPRPGEGTGVQIRKQEKRVKDNLLDPFGS